MAIQSVKSPADLQKLAATDAKAAPGPLDKAGDFADLLSELGSAPDAEKLALSVTNPLQKTSVGFNQGASFVATAQVLRSGAALFTQGISADTGLSFAEDATRAPRWLCGRSTASSRRSGGPWEAKRCASRFGKAAAHLRGTTVPWLEKV